MKRFVQCCLCAVLFGAPATAEWPITSSWWSIAGVGSGPGDHGSVWASDLYLYNNNAHAIVVMVSLQNAAGYHEPLAYPVAAGGSTTVEDVMADFGLTGAGALRIWSQDNSEFYVTSRTYNTEADGDTLGQGVPGQSWCTGNFGFDAGLLFQGIQLNSRFRTNFGFSASSAVPFTLMVYNGDGTLAAAIPVQVGLNSAIQISLGASTNAVITNGYAVVFIDPAYPTCLNGYASVVDNGTNDATYIGGDLIMRTTR